MSKEAAVRAMREARYRGGSTTMAPSSPVTPAKPVAKQATKPPVAKAAPRPEPAVDAAATTDALCGHRSMNGRTCTREHGHAAKSHRYS